jgi:hypothetical protein
LIFGEKIAYDQQKWYIKTSRKDLLLVKFIGGKQGNPRSPPCWLEFQVFHWV